MKKSRSENDKARTERRQQRKKFISFFKYANLSWGYIGISVVVTVIYYLTVTKLPGSTAALFAGQFTRDAIQGVLVNYGSMFIMQTLCTLSSLVAVTFSTRSVRKAIWTRMLGIQSSYYDEHSSSELLSAVTSDAETTVTNLINVIILAPGLLMYLSTALPMIGDFSPKLLWSVVILIPFYIVYALFMGRWQYKVGSGIQLRIGGLTGYLADRIRNLSMIKSFVTEKEEEEKGIKTARELYKANIRYSYVNSVLVAYTIGAEIIGIVIAVVWGCILLRSGEINLQQWLAFYLFVPTINTCIRQLTNIWTNLKDVEGRAARLSTLIEAPQENLNEQNPDPVPSGDIVFDNVQFSYNKQNSILNGLSFNIPHGKTTAIVGMTGSGKTTILRLIEKLYSPQGGCISVNAVPLQDMNLTKWRERISYVNQDDEMFSGTVREALTYGIKREISDADLDRVTKLAGIYEYIKAQPQGYDMQLASSGSSMSGGQRQRIIIALELLRNTDILLLDEPTSALDAETAASVNRTLFDSFEGKTIVAVTHELSFISRADQIVLIDDGKAAACGTHDELMNSCEMYRNLVEEQSYEEVFEK